MTDDYENYNDPIDDDSQEADDSTETSTPDVNVNEAVLDALRENAHTSRQVLEALQARNQADDDNDGDEDPSDYEPAISYDPEKIQERAVQQVRAELAPEVKAAAAREAVVLTTEVNASINWLVQQYKNEDIDPAFLRDKATQVIARDVERGLLDSKTLRGSRESEELFAYFDGQLAKDRRDGKLPKRKAPPQHHTVTPSGTGVAQSNTQREFNKHFGKGKPNLGSISMIPEKSGKR